MRILTRRIILVACLLFCLPCLLHAQITLKVRDKEIRSVIRQIENTSDYRFFFSSSLPDLTRKVTLDLHDSPIRETLDRLFQKTDIAYAFKETYQITLTARDASSGKQADPLRVSGTVHDSQGRPLTGVSVIVKGSQRGVATDASGRYQLEKLPENAVLVFSYIGYTSQEIPVRNRTTVDAVLEDDLQVLDDVVVIGYGTMNKRDLTMSVQSVKSKDFIGGNTANPLQTIVGKVPGLTISSSAGTDPNGGVSVQLRGANSINADKGPLIVVDGIPGGNIGILQKEDIVSIDVLKDASAAAIYGTRASGGVILVTTRMGREGKPSVSFTSELTTETVHRKPDILSAEEWVTHGGADLGAQTDWFNTITRTPLTNRQIITLSGGTKSFTAYASLFYKKAEGMSIGSDRQEIGGRFNFSFKTLNDRLELTGRVNYVDIKSNFTDNSIFRSALTLNPTISPYDPDDLSGYNILTSNNEKNPLANIMLREDNDHSTRLQATASAKLNITDGLSTTFTAGITSGVGNSAYWESSLHRNSRDNNREGYASQNWGRSGSESIDWTINYDRLFGRHSLRLLAGYSFQQLGGSETFKGSNSNFPVDGTKWYDMGSGTYLKEGRSSISSYKGPRERLGAYFGRVNYSFANKYLLSASIRYEGSSKFGPENRYGTFPAVSAAWRISEESFLRNVPWINDLRIRAGYGRTGNQGFSPGVTTRMYKADTDPWYVQGQWISVYGLSRNVNYGLKWETKDEYNAGVDFDLLDHRLSGKFDVYKRKVNDMIYNIDVPQPPAVFAQTTMNVGSMQNAGWEVELTGVVVNNKNWNYTTTVQASRNTTTLNSLWGSQTFWDTMSFPAPGDPGTAVRLTAGEKIGRFYVWKYAGLDADGGWLLYDKDNNVIPAAEKTKADKRYTGNAMPKIMLSWDNTVSYKNFDLTLFFRSWIGHDVFNMTEMYYGLQNTESRNMLRSAYGRNRNIRGEKELCDYFIEDGTFLKLDAATLGYTIRIPSIKSWIRSVRVSVTGRNLFCLTNYTGLDPEVDINGLTPGFEGLYVYPRTRVFTFSLQLNF